jgi:hypothetical protein
VNDEAALPVSVLWTVDHVAVPGQEDQGRST